MRLDHNMLLFSSIGLLGLTIANSAAKATIPNLANSIQLSPPPSRNLSAATLGGLPSLNGDVLPNNVDPRFTFVAKFAPRILDKKSAYLSSLLALADLSKKGWTRNMMREENYSFLRYGDITIHIHARQNPSTMQYRHAIWGLYYAILALSANEYKACTLTLYWSERQGETAHVLGYVTILGGPTPGINSDNATKESPKIAIPTGARSPEPGLTNLTITGNGSTSMTTAFLDSVELTVEVSLLAKPLDIDGVFRTMSDGMVYLASRPQSQSIIYPEVAEDYPSRTFLRWDASHLVVEPGFQYQYAIFALAHLAEVMYQYNRFDEARFIISLGNTEVGRGWLYRHFG